MIIIDEILSLKRIVAESFEEYNSLVNNVNEFIENNEDMYAELINQVISLTKSSNKYIKLFLGRFVSSLEKIFKSLLKKIPIFEELIKSIDIDNNEEEWVLNKDNELLFSRAKCIKYDSEYFYNNNRGAYIFPETTNIEPIHNSMKSIIDIDLTEDYFESSEGGRDRKSVV